MTSTIPSTTSWTSTTTSIGKKLDVSAGAALSAAPVVEHPPSVVLVVREGDDLVVVRQHRVGAAGPVVELPAGKIEPGESAVEAARRELAEECGLAAEDWSVLGSFWAAPSYSTERVTVLAARVSGTAVAPADADEAIDVLRIAASAAERAVEDAGSIAALALAGVPRAAGPA